MARAFIDGFEAGDLKLWDAVNGSPSVSSGIADMDGTYCVGMTAATSQQYLKKTLSANAEYYVAFRYKPSNSFTNQRVLLIYNGATKLCSLMRNSSSLALEARSASGTLLATSSASLSNNSIYLIEIHFKPNTSGGIFQVTINGSLDIDFSGNTGSALAITTLYIGCFDITGSYVYAYFDNIIIDDSSPIGATRIQAIRPTAAGNSTQMAPSELTNYQCVDEVPPNENDFVSTNTIGQLDLYGAGDLTGSIESVKCVQVQALAKYEGTPTPTNLELAVRSGGTNYFSGDKTVPAASAQLCNLWEVNPNTSAAWLDTEVNAMEIGVKAVA